MMKIHLPETIYVPLEKKQKNKLLRSFPIDVLYIISKDGQKFNLLDTFLKLQNPKKLANDQCIAES